jgi:predicted nucleic acid-binding protein
MKVLVDTNVWSLALLRKDQTAEPAAIQLRELIESGQPIYLAGVVLMEVLRGIRHSEQFRKVQKCLEPFPILELTRAGYVDAALLGSHCRSKGVQCGGIDILIAQLAISHDCHLLATDQDFTHIARHSDLKLVASK